MIWTAWNNGAHHATGAGYGFKIEPGNRDADFQRGWGTVFIHLPGGATAEANVDRDAFWGPQCREVISQDIGQWLLSNGHAPWNPGSPPKFEVEATQPRHFHVRRRVAV